MISLEKKETALYKTVGVYTIFIPVTLLYLIASRLQSIAVFDEILAEEKPQIVNVGVKTVPKCGS